MSVKRFLSPMAALALIAWALPASAQWVVVDPTNLVQNVLTAAHTLTQIDNQVLQLQNEAQMLTNEARNLQGLNFSALGRLQATLANAQRLFDQAQGLSFQLASVQQDYLRLYPDTYPPLATRAQINADWLSRWTYSRGALGTALSVQAQADQNFASDESVLADLVGKSQSAVGALEASQATNQLLALLARQTVQAQQITIAQDRAVALEQARAVEADERARELRQRFMTSATTYTAQPVRGL